jgi:hypothetical protein
MKLARDVAFLDRLEYILVTQARVVLAETGVGSTHAARSNYSKLVVNFPQEYSRKAATLVVGGVNVIGTVTVLPGPPETVTTTVTDAALLSQVATFWNTLASIDTGN